MYPGSVHACHVDGNGAELSGSMAIEGWRDRARIFQRLVGFLNWYIISEDIIQQLWIVVI